MGGYAGDLDRSLRYASYGRRFFNTHHGRVSIGPADVRNGDKICVFMGKGALFVLRDTDTTAGNGDRGPPAMERARTTEELDGDDEAFKLVGDAYVHGLLTVGKPSQPRPVDLSDSSSCRSS